MRVDGVRKRGKKYGVVPHDKIRKIRMRWNNLHKLAPKRAPRGLARTWRKELKSKRQHLMKWEKKKNWVDVCINGYSYKWVSSILIYLMDEIPQISLNESYFFHSNESYFSRTFHILFNYSIYMWEKRNTAFSYLLKQKICYMYIDIYSVVPLKYKKQLLDTYFVHRHILKLHKTWLHSNFRVIENPDIKRPKF
jgi:hypothetical protein